MQLPKPPKLFRTKPAPEAEVEQQPVPEQTEEAPRVWSPAPEPKAEASAPAPEEDLSRYAPPPAIEETPVVESAPAAEDEFIPEPDEAAPAEVISEEEPVLTESKEPEQPEEVVEEVSEVEPVAEESVEPENDEKYARPKEVPEPKAEEPAEKYAPAAKEPKVSVSDSNEPLAPEENEKAIYKLLGKKQKIVRAKSVSSIPFSDIWYTAEKVAYIRDESTRFALVPFLSDDLSDFYKALEQGYTGQSSYAVRFAGESYRVERIITLSGTQYNCRKMPGSVPDIFTLGLPKHIVDYLLTLSREAGLILFGGPTGMGKTTSASALMKKFLEENGGFMYTIEDPPEMPLDGLYQAENGGLGLCKQCPVDNERWGDGIKSALRSRPRYILVGEIRTPETASQVLRAATSGHLVLSTIHASTVEDSLESIIKYASGAGLTESLAADLLARGILAVVHQKLEGSETLRPVISAAFANPHLTGGDQMRSLIRNNNINLQTLIEAQSSRLFQGRPLFEDKEGK